MVLLSDDNMSTTRKMLCIFGLCWIGCVSLPLFLISFFGLRRYKRHEFIKIRNPNFIEKIIIIGAVITFIFIPIALIDFGFNFTNDITILLSIVAALLNIFLIIGNTHFSRLCVKVKLAGMYLHNKKINILIY